MTDSLCVSRPSEPVFLRTLLHDFRSPLASILALANFGRLRPSLRPDESRALLLDISSAAAHLNELAEMALFVTKAEVNTFAVERKLFNLDRLAKTVVEELRPQADGMGVIIENDIRFHNLIADAQLVEVALRSLLRSAIKYSTSANVVRLAPLVRPAERGEQAGFTISFSMPGTGNNVGERIPSRFGREGLFQLDLALLFSMQVANGHGGALTARTTGDYLEIEFLLPQ